MQNIRIGKIIYWLDIHANVQSSFSGYKEMKLLQYGMGNFSVGIVLFNIHCVNFYFIFLRLSPP